MAFGTSLRAAADSARPIGRRVVGLVSAVERFPIFGFHGTFIQLYLATGASPFNWTPGQLDVAAKMLGEAHDSWSNYRDEAWHRVHVAKHIHPPPTVPNGRAMFREWLFTYFDAERSAQWHVSSDQVAGKVPWPRPS